MNCRRVNNLLSAYIDAELTGEEMLAVREHLHMCPGCQAEQEALLQTKRLLASLAIRTPRAELESLLLSEVDREAQRPLRRWLRTPEFVRDWAFAWETALQGGDASMKVNPVLATVALSLAGLWLTATGLERSQERATHYPFPDVIIAYKTPMFVGSPVRGASSAAPIANVGYGDGATISPASQASSADLIPLTPDYTEMPVLRAQTPSNYALPGIGRGLPYRTVSGSFGASFFSVP